MQVWGKSVNVACMNDHGGGRGCIKLARSKKLLANGEEFKMLAALGMAKALKINKILKIRLWKTSTQRMSCRIVPTRI